MWISREIVLGNKGLSGGEGEGGDIDVSCILGYRLFEDLDKLDGIGDEKSEFAILVLAKY